MSERVRQPLAAAGACAAACALFIGAVYAITPLQRFDAKTLTGLGQLGDRGQAPIPHTIAHSVDPVTLLCLLGVICIAGMAWGRPRRVVAAIAVVAGANVTTQVLKLALAHPRVQPELRFGIEEAALPSGHATAAMSLAVAAILVVPRSLRVPAVVAGAGFALVQGVAIVVLVWHYPSDVLSGYLIATTFGFLALAAVRATEERWPEGTDSRTEAGTGAVRSASAIGLAALAGMLIAVASTRGDDLAEYLRDHTLGMLAALTIAMAAASLAAWLAVATDE